MFSGNKWSRFSVTTQRLKTLHCLHCCLLFTLIAVYEAFVLNAHNRCETFDPWTKYGIIFTLFLYLVRHLPLFIFPMFLFEFCGLVFFNAFPPKVQLRGSPVGAPFICFRTVTRGDFPSLVRDNTHRNMKVCEEVGLKNFHFEVVANKSVNLAPHELVRETVVPEKYRSKRGTLFKGRALQYCLEDAVNQLADNDWIVHLDEETLMTVESLKGILNFVADGRHQFGQGLITYSGGKVENWFTTLIDSFRVGDDMGKIRCQFKMFHKPIFGWKGSFMVIQVGAERRVTFDHGPEGSMTEDIFLALKASEAGYSFDFIDGHMMEESPFTVYDLVQQRKRWIQGSYSVVRSKNIPFRSKMLFAVAMYAFPFVIPNLVLSVLFPIPCHLVIDLIFGFMAAVTIHLHVYGVVRSFSLNSSGKLRCVLCVVGALCVMPFSVAVDNVAHVWALLGRKDAFYVVDKKSAKLTKIKGKCINLGALFTKKKLNDMQIC